MRLLQLRWSIEAGSTVVILRGDVDAGARLDLEAVGVVADAAPRVVVDLSDVGFIDTTGLDLLEALARRPTVEVRNPTAPVLRLLRRTEHVIEDWPTLRAALS